MAVSQVKNIVATTGTYMKDGVEKKRYLTVGSLFIYDDGGMSIKLDAVPTGFDGNLSVYDRDNQNNQQQAPQGYQQPPTQQGYNPQGYPQNPQGQYGQNTMQHPQHR
ncbi:hypothetical protein [Arcobacter arenosus]|uniref:Uncharacterized protein n=1 Tax=Arcobacter arenosus TaxID=2576037 RepID=A0A5R8Y4M7_9BACT|nr:hypothetical protein [Arcobacter arenosus]TLP41069.1 hypothetical protein FDK22_03345 [Arcobacter arenosus]